jgi:hypothetical protein
LFSRASVIVSDYTHTNLTIGYPDGTLTNHTVASSRRAARCATQASESPAQELDKSLREIRQLIGELSARQTNTVRRQLASFLQADPEDDDITFSTGLAVETPREVRGSVGHGGRRERESIADRVLGADRAAENVRDDRAPESSQATMDRLLPTDRVRTTNRVPTASDRVQRMDRAPSDVGDERAPVSTQPTMGRVPRDGPCPEDGPGAQRCQRQSGAGTFDTGHGGPGINNWTVYEERTARPGTSATITR